ncbi:DUF6906 family protein [Enterococcus faecalis]|uniref:DUF6906 family protein n=1 Tax=Enterococcus faecalis TaxID=1351 RepID=UPI0019276711|nr:hypothetical protein [Enterococcus faecalis]MCF0231569.1 hypothetical protein [Enterococcus sp.]MDN3200478.1 hypothetical protein [Enterococcus faecalis]MEB5927383.1 hypothetical protein [Enterococcus faecalis]
MKQAKRLVRKEKELLTSKRLNPENWVVRKRNKTSIVFQHKESGSIRELSLN